MNQPDLKTYMTQEQLRSLVAVNDSFKPGGANARPWRTLQKAGESLDIGNGMILRNVDGKIYLIVDNGGKPVGSSIGRNANGIGLNLPPLVPDKDGAIVRPNAPLPPPTQIVTVTELDVRDKVLALLNERADTKGLTDSEKLELTRLIFVRAAKVDKNTSSEVDYLKYVNNLFKSKDWPRLIASVRAPEIVDAQAVRNATAARYDNHIKFPNKLEVFEEEGKRAQENGDAAWKKALERYAQVFEDQRISDYANGRSTREQALSGLTGKARSRVAAAIDAIDRMKIGASGGRGGAAGVEYDPKKVTDAVNEFVARNGGNLGIDIALTRSFAAALEKALAKIDPSDPSYNSMMEALRHLKRHEQTVIKRNAQGDGVVDAINRNSLSQVSSQNLEILRAVLTKLLASGNLSPEQTKNYQDALTKVGNQQLRNRTDANRTPGGAIVKGTLPAYQNLSAILAAANGELKLDQLKRLNEMLLSGTKLDKILSDLQGGWRPSTAIEKAQSRSDMQLTISDQSSLDIVASRVLPPSQGKTLVLVSSEANKKEMEDRLGITAERAKIDAENIERAKVKLPRLYYNPNVIVLVANNKPPADAQGRAVHPRDAVLNQLGSNAGSIRRVIGVGGAGVLDVAKGVMVSTDAQGVTKGLNGSLISVPTVLSTTSISTLYSVFGVDPKLLTTQVPSETVVPLGEMLKGAPVNASGESTPQARARYANGLKFATSGLGDMTASLSSNAEQDYAKVVGDIPLSGTLLSRQRSNVDAGGPTAMLDTVVNSVNTRNANWQTDPVAMLSLIEQLHAYGVDSVDGVRVLATKVGGEHDFFNAAESLPFGKKLTHGEWVAVGTLLQLYAYGKLTGDFSSFNHYAAAMKKVGLPSSMQELGTRYKLTRAEMEQAIVIAGEVNFNGQGLSNIPPLDSNAPQSRKSLFRAFLELGLPIGATAEQRAVHFKGRAKVLLDDWIGGNQAGVLPPGLAPRGGAGTGGPVPTPGNGGVVNRIPPIGDLFYMSTNRRVINDSITIADPAGGPSKTAKVTYTIRNSATQTGQEAGEFATYVQRQNPADWGSASIWRARTDVPLHRQNEELVPLKDRISLFNTVRGMNTITAVVTVDGKEYTATIAYRVRWDPVTKQNHFYVGLQTSPKGTPVAVTLALYKLVARAALAAGFDSIYTIRDRPATNKLDQRLFGAVTEREIVPGEVFYNRIQITGNPKAAQFLED
jgi:hypothetical protein